LTANTTAVVHVQKTLILHRAKPGIYASSIQGMISKQKKIKIMTASSDTVNCILPPDPSLLPPKFCPYTFLHLH